MMVVFLPAIKSFSDSNVDLFAQSDSYIVTVILAQTLTMDGQQIANFETQKLRSTIERVMRREW